MAISIHCSACGKRYQAADHMAGRRVRCKHCGVTFQLPSQPTSNEPFEQVADVDVPGGMDPSGAFLDDAYAPAPAPPPKLKPMGAPAPGYAATAAAQRHAPPAPQENAPFGDASFDANANASGGDDVEAVFEEAFQEYRAPRGNTLFIFPGSRFLDRWLSTILVVVCVAWLAYLSYSSAHGDPLWVPVVRLMIILGAFTGIVFPICLKGARKAARKMNYDLPATIAFRAYATFLLPVTIGCAVWLSAGSVPGFIFGVAMGLIVTLPVMWLLFRIRGDDAPTSMGYGAAALGGSVIAAAVLLALLNFLTLVLVRSAKIEPTLAMSPFGPGFAWDAKAPATDGSLERKAAALASSRPAPANEPVEVKTKAFADGTDPDAPGKDVDPAEKSPEETVATTDNPTAPPTNPDAPPAESVGVASKGNPRKKIEHGAVVAEATERITGEMRAIVYPALTGSAVAVVRSANRDTEDLVEVWDTTDWQQKPRTTRFARPANTTEPYQISADGKYLARFAEFPSLSIQIFSFDAEDTLRPYMKLDPAAPRPRMIGFSAADQIVLMNEKAAKPNFEARGVSPARVIKNTPVPGLHATAGTYALSHDGKLFAVMIRDEDAPIAGQGSNTRNGRVEIYGTTTGKLARRIVVDELEWNAEVRPAGVDFSQGGDRIAVLFEHRGQGLFICWGNDNDIPLHIHLYPGGLVPEGVDTRSFRGESFTLIDDGRAFVLYGSSVFDTVTGKLLGQMGIKDVTSQFALTADTLLLTQQEGSNTSVLEVRLDLNRARRELATKE